MNIFTLMSILLYSSANMSFSILKKLIFSKTLSARVKIICYQALIRPILTYGSYIWFNLCPSYRVIERKILRACTNIWRTTETQYKHHTLQYCGYRSSGYTHIRASSWTLSPIIVDDWGKRNQRAAILSKRSILCKCFKEWFRLSRSFYLCIQTRMGTSRTWIQCLYYTT